MANDFQPQPMQFKQFDPNQYKALFDQSFGAGTFDSGMQRAQQIGQQKAMADFAQKDLIARYNQARQKALSPKLTYDDATSFWNDPNNKKALQDKGAYGAVEAIKNDPQQQEAIKSQGYNLTDYYDAMYNAASDGKFKSERDYNSFAGQLNKDNTDKKANQDSIQAVLDNEKKQAELKQQEAQKQQDWNNSLIGKGYNGLGRFFDYINTQGERADNQLTGTLFPKANAKANQAQADLISNQLKKNPNDQVAKVNADEFNNAIVKPATRPDEKFANYLGGTEANVLPYLIGDGILAGVGKGASMIGEGALQKGLTNVINPSRLVTNPYAQKAIQGIQSGGVGSGVQMGATHAIEGTNYTPQQIGQNIATNAIMGGVGNPAFHGAGVLAGKAAQVVGDVGNTIGAKTLGKYATGEVPTFTGKPSQSVLDQLNPKIKPTGNATTNYDHLFQTSTPKSDAKVSGGTNSESIIPKLKVGSTNISPTPHGMLQPSELDNHGYGLFDTHANVEQPKPNPLDAPYHQGDTIPDTTGHIGSKTDKAPFNLQDLKTKAIIKSVDNLHPLQQFDKFTSNVLGRELNPSESTHTLGLNSRGTDMITNQMLNENMVNKNGEAVGPSLKDITSQIPKGKDTEFRDYLINKHAITRMGRGEKVFPDEMNMTTGKAEEKVKQYEQANPKFKDIADNYYNFDKQKLQYAVDHGLMTEDMMNGLLENNPNYVSNQRLFSDLEKLGGGKGNASGKGFADQSNPYKSGTGSQRKIVDPFESNIESTAKLVKTAKRNEVMQALIKHVSDNPEAFKNVAEILPTPKGSGTFLDAMGNKHANFDDAMDEFNKSFEQKPDLTHGNVVTGIVDGNKVHVKLHDPHLVEALTNLNPVAQHVVIDTLGQVTRIMKITTTGVNPIFGITRNLSKDIPTAFANSKTTKNPIKFGTDLVKAFKDVVMKGDIYKQFRAIGGGHASPVSSDINLLSKAKNEILPKQDGVLNGVKHYGKKVLHGLETVNNVLESAPRLAEYNRIVKQGGGSYDSKVKGLYEANDVTTNFNRYGTYAKQIDSVVPYFNAAVQGLDKTGRMLLNPKTATQTILKATGAISIPSVLEFIVNHNDPNYQQLSDNVKDGNICIPLGDGTFYKIPVPREYGAIFHVGVQRALRAMVDQDPHAFDHFATTVMNNFLPPNPVTSTIGQPLIDVARNKNYTGGSIVPADLQGESPRYQYDAQTSKLAKSIGNLTNISPKQIDYLTKQYTGGIGQFGIPLTNGVNGSFADALKQQVVADPTYSNDIMQRFYDQKTKLDQAYSDYTNQGVQSINNDDGLRKQMDKASTAIGKIRKQTKEVMNDSSLSAQERRLQLAYLQQQMNQIALQNTQK